MPSPTSKLWILGSALVAAALVVLYVFDPATVGIYPPCVFRAITGYLCAGCGATRATHQLLHGNLAEAFRLNAMYVLMLPVAFIGAAAEASGAGLLRKRWVGWTTVAVLIAWGVVRNVIGM